MVFLERKLNNTLSHHFEYSCIDVFGELKIKSKHQLSAELLDMIAMKALKDTPVGNSDGVSWELHKQNEWDEVKDEVAYTAKVNFNLKHFSLNLKKVWDFLKNIVKR